MNLATPNLPSRDFDRTIAFYGSIGFEVKFCDLSWMILVRDGITLEMFMHPKLKPSKSWFSCCLRLDDMDGFFAECKAARIPRSHSGALRLHAPMESDGMRIGALTDIDGTLLRLIQN